MLKKFNNKILLIVFVILLVVVGITKMVQNNKGERNFREFLAVIDTARVDKIEFIKNEGDPIALKRNNGIWMVAKTDQQARADESAVDNIMQSLADLSVKRRVGTREEQWKKYEVTDSLGTRLKIYTDDEVAADIMVGRFSYKQQGRGFSISTNARLFNEEDVYTVEGNLSMSVKRDFNGLRDHTLLKAPKEHIQQVSLKRHGKSFNLSKNGDQWLADGEMADSASVVKYLNKLKDVKAHNFTESFDAGSNPVDVVKVKLSSGEEVQVEAYADGEKYVMRSSANQGAVFKESKSIYDRMFVDKSKLITPDE